MSDDMSDDPLSVEELNDIAADRFTTEHWLKEICTQLAGLRRELWVTNDQMLNTIAEELSNIKGRMEQWPAQLKRSKKKSD